MTALIQEAQDTPDTEEEEEEEEGDQEEEGEEMEGEGGMEGGVGVRLLFVSMEERMRALAKECVRLMGRDLFVRTHAFVRECKDRGEGAEDIEREMEEREGKGGGDERWRHWGLVDQLIFMEDHCEDADDPAPPQT